MVESTHFFIMLLLHRESGDFSILMKDIESTHFPTSLYGPIVDYVVRSYSNNVTIVVLMPTHYYYLANHQQIHFLYMSHVMHSQMLATIHGLDLGIVIILLLGIYFVSCCHVCIKAAKVLALNIFNFIIK
jgi:hypothetical protein